MSRVGQFKKGEGGRPKGATNKENAVKEIVRQSLWEVVKERMVNEGIGKYWTEMMNMEGKDYIIAFSTLLEYFQPKLNRITHEGDADNPINYQVNIIPAGSSMYQIATDEKAIDTERDKTYIDADVQQP